MVEVEVGVWAVFSFILFSLTVIHMVFFFFCRKGKFSFFLFWNKFGWSGAVND